MKVLEVVFYEWDYNSVQSDSDHEFHFRTHDTGTISRADKPTSRYNNSAELLYESCEVQYLLKILQITPNT